MTYKSHARHPLETGLAIIFTATLISFICSLCVGNYLRACRARERQRGRREARAQKEERRRRRDVEEGEERTFEADSDFTGMVEGGAHVRPQHSFSPETDNDNDSINTGITQHSSSPETYNDNDSINTGITGLLSA